MLEDDDQEYQSPGNDREFNHPSYPMGMIDKLWDDYHELRDNKLSGHSPLEFKDGETQEDKVILRAEDHKSLILKMEKL